MQESYLTRLSLSWRASTGCSREYINKNRTFAELSTKSKVRGWRVNPVKNNFVCHFLSYKKKCERTRTASNRKNLMSAERRGPRGLIFSGHFRRGVILFIDIFSKCWNTSLVITFPDDRPTTKTFSVKVSLFADSVCWKLRIFRWLT